MLSELIEKIQDFANPEKAKILQGFFKTGEGEYGEGDIFLGVTVPQIRKIAKEYSGLNLIKIEKLLKSKIHEHRLTAIIILGEKYKKAKEEEKENIFNFYLNNSQNVNNWDLVDLSAPKIIGNFLLDKDKNILYKLVRSENLWEKRIAIISTFSFIRKEEFEDCLAISELLLNDKHDLIHKAVGWMLREIGKRNLEVEENFLKQHYKNMPRTMLRYAIEKFEEEKRKSYLSGKV
ncbi:DNA alkylation repair protein [Candidatus Pacearchaeota archaeon]|nr:DNA alkylation repair protein [Candidatus Pacearchaeota archaeon]